MLKSAISSDKMNIIDAVPFYLNAESLKNIGAYYGDDIYKKKSWSDYMAAIVKDKDKKEKKQ